MRVRSGFRRFVRWVLVPVVIAGLLTQAAPPARAEDELQKAQQQLESIRQQKEEVKNALAQAYYQAEEAQVQLKQVENDLAAANGQLAVITNQLTIADKELKQVEADLTTAQKKYDERQAQLAKRVRAINEEGRVNALAVLLGANSFSDFISRFEMLKAIIQRDNRLFADVRTEKKELEEKQAVATARKNQLANLKAQAEVRRTTIAVKRDERVQVSRSLEANKSRLQAQYDAFDREEANVMQLVVDLQRRLNRVAGKFAPIYPVKPVLVTDPFGPRIHPILNVPRPHNGTDFNAYMGQNVMAIEDGVVIMATWNDAYGNLVVIDHGGGISSWYGHNSQLLVKVNQEVKQGQIISKAGSTGWSTGPHVHLEIRVDGNPEDPMNYLQ